MESLAFLHYGKGAVICQDVESFDFFTVMGL
jgi:hypothetical protein